MCATFTVLWILCVWGEHVLMFPFGQNMRRLCEPRESLNRERESFPHGFPLHRITLESDRAPCFHLHHQKGASVPPAIIKGPIQPARDDRITLRPKTKLSLPLVSPVPPILHFRCLSGHAIWASSAFKSSWEFHIYKLGSRNYNVRCVQIILVQDGMGKKQPFTLLQVCVPSEWFWNWISLWKWIDISRYQNCFKESPEFPHSRHCGEVHVCSTAKYDLSDMTSMQHNTCFVFFSMNALWKPFWYFHPKQFE